MFRDFSFLAATRPCAMLVRDGGRPMADAHEERALLDLCNAHGLRLSARLAQRSAPCARADKIR